MAGRFASSRVRPVDADAPATVRAVARVIACVLIDALFIHRLPDHVMNETATIATQTPVLEMRSLAVASMKNPNVSVAKDVNWTVNAGEFWVVGAPQQSGKSDFLMTAGGIMSPADGEISFLGEAMPIFDESRMEHRLKLGFVFDGGQLVGSLTVAENIALPLRYHSRTTEAEIESRVDELLELTELKPVGEQHTGERRAQLAATRGTCSCAGVVA